MKALRKLMLATTALASCAIAPGMALADGLPSFALPGTWGVMTVDHAMVDMGAVAWLDRPGATPGNSAAKFNQYGTRTNDIFLNALNLGASTADKGVQVEILGKNIGTNAQDLELDVNNPGRNYFSYGWYQVPNLRSNTAETFYNGVGSNVLSVQPNVVQQLYNGVFNTTTTKNNVQTTGPGNNTTLLDQKLITNLATGAPISAFIPQGCFLPGQNGTNGSGAVCKPGVTPVQTTINQNLSQITLGIQHDRQEINDQWTPNENWDVKVNYSHDHRYGVQEQGFLFSSSTSTPLAQVPMPIDDITQNASISAEYNGISPWGLKWNGMLKYDMSIYTDQYSNYYAENPFGGPGSPVGATATNCPVAAATTNLNCYGGFGSQSTTPTNGANAVMGQIGADLPWFKSSRFMSTFQFNDMQQNQSFQPMTVNTGTQPAGVVNNAGLYSPTSGSGLVTLAPLARNSLDGNIYTILSNNVLTSNITSDVKNKVTYRYYSDQNTTPQMYFSNWALNDSAVATGTGSYANHTAIFSSYIKQNASDELTYRPNSTMLFGVLGGWENYSYQYYPVNYTNEGTVKLYTNLNPWDWLTVRAQDAQSWRRYGNYNWLEYIGNPQGTQGIVEAPALVDFNVANRNRNVGSLYFDIKTPVDGLTFTPTASMRWDNYPTDYNLLAAQTTANAYQQGVAYDHNWTAGVEADWTINSALQVTASYMYSNEMEQLLASQTAGSVYYSNMSDYVNTIMAGLTWQAIPDKLVFKLSATHELANDKWVTGPMAGCMTTALIANGGANCGIVSPGNPAYPSIFTRFDHIDAKLLYKIDQSLLQQYGFNEGFFQLKFLYEQNYVNNWQTNDTLPYMYSTLNASTTSMRTMVFLAGDNPNYRAEALMASVILKW